MPLHAENYRRDGFGMFGIAVIRTEHKVPPLRFSFPSGMGISGRDDSPWRASHPFAKNAKGWGTHNVVYGYHIRQIARR
jgi:hypothetical protein